MNDFGPQLAGWGIAIGLLLFVAGFFALPGSSPFVWKLWAGGFIGSYLILPLAGLVYDLKSGDFEKREGYKP